MTVADTSVQQLDDVLDRAASAGAHLALAPPPRRATWLRSAADALENAAENLVPIARAETHLPDGRLRSELARTCYQLRMFADVVLDGAQFQAIIDHADPSWILGPRPDIRRVREPLGPVLVFAASNFPFAFSVAGGDTASALAAGCPVVVKANPGHLELSAQTTDVLAGALVQAGAPVGTVATINGIDIGRVAVVNDRIRAAAFTGSTAGGRALFDLCGGRANPIPFYGELGSANPTFVTRAAVDARGPSIVAGFVASFTLGVGQFCTKPGILCLPAGHGLEAELVRAVEQSGEAEMLMPRLRESYQQGLGEMTDAGGIEPLVVGSMGPHAVAPSLLRTRATDVLADPERLLGECFGPVSLIVEYDSPDDLCALAASFDGTLTATVHAEVADDEMATTLLAILEARTGRIVWNGWPTGVAVGWAMHHGGPYPATTSPLHTSVGATALERFLRPVCYQDVPDHLLPPPLQDANPWSLPRRVDGEPVAAPERSPQ
jgi:NADP-dependent aldehyde dehydrogenase